MATRGRPRNPAIRATVNAWAAVVNIGRETLTKKLIAAGVDLDTKPGPRAEDVFKTLLADPAQARAAKAKEETELLAIKRAEREGRLVELDLAHDMIANAFLPVRQAFLGLPGELARRVNPDDPKHSQRELEAWVDAKLESLRAGLPDKLLDSDAWWKAEEAVDVKPKPRPKPKRTRRVRS